MEVHFPQKNGGKESKGISPFIHNAPDHNKQREVDCISLSAGATTTTREKATTKLVLSTLYCWNWNMGIGGYMLVVYFGSRIVKFYQRARDWL